MNIRRLFVTFSLSCLGLLLSARADDKAPAATKPAPNGYHVVLDLKISAAGTVDDATVFSSDDKSVDHMLERLAMEMVRPAKFQPKLKEGKAVPYTARAPFNFEVENDEGPEVAANTPKPSIHNAIRPTYPADLAEKGEVGGVIFDMAFAADGSVTSLKTLRASNPEFEKAALEAIKQWSFSPAKKDGVAVATRGYLAIGFETDVRRPDWKWLYPPRPSVGYYAIVHRTLPDQPAPASATPGSPAKADEKPVAK